MDSENIVQFTFSMPLEHFDSLCRASRDVKVNFDCYVASCTMFHLARFIRKESDSDFKLFISKLSKLVKEKYND